MRNLQRWGGEAVQAHNHHGAGAPGAATPLPAESPGHHHLAPLGAGNHGTAAVATISDNAQSRQALGEVKANHGTDNRDFAETASEHQQPDAGSAKARLCAMLANRGFGLVELAGGEFLIHRWDCSKVLGDLLAVQRFARLVCGEVR